MKPIFIATRGSALALAQASLILNHCQASFPGRKFELKIIKTTGDKLQTLSPAASNPEGGKGLFTKELESALLDGEAGLAVHSLKDLPTELPPGLELGAAPLRGDARDVLIYRGVRGTLRGMNPGSGIQEFAPGAAIATSSTRRQAQLLALRPDLKIIPIRGNVGTRLQRLSERAELDGLVLALAGLHRLSFEIDVNGALHGEGVPRDLFAKPFEVGEMLPCVGQAALGIEIRTGDAEIGDICRGLNHPETESCVIAERAFLRGMGGGCLSPVAAFGTVENDSLRLRAVSFRGGPARKAEGRGSLSEATALGELLARELA